MSAPDRLPPEAEHARQALPTEQVGAARLILSFARPSQPDPPGRRRCRGIAQGAQNSGPNRRLAASGAPRVVGSPLGGGAPNTGVLSRGWVGGCWDGREESKAGLMVLGTVDLAQADAALPLLGTISPGLLAKSPARVAPFLLKPSPAALFRFQQATSGLWKSQQEAGEIVARLSGCAQQPGLGRLGRAGRSAGTQRWDYPAGVPARPGGNAMQCNAITEL